LFPGGPADDALVALGQIGLVFLTFLMGIEFEFGHLRRTGRAASAVALGGIALPFALGLALSPILHPRVAPDVDATGMALFMATALSITAIPILGRIMMQFGLQRSRFGVLTITAAAIDDALGWMLLAAVSAIVKGGFDALAIVRMLLLTVLFGGFVVLGMRPTLIRLVSHGIARRGGLDLATFSVLVLSILLCALITEWIGIFAVFGPFVLGAALWDQKPLREAMQATLQPFVAVVLLPVFFTYTGLRTDVGLLGSWAEWGLCGLVLLAAVAGKVIGAGVAARACGMSPRESACVAVMMNTRALMGLVAINVGRDLGVISDALFCMLVLMAIVTTFMATPILRRLLRGTEWEAEANRARAFY
jgi:Kef-type K+ transport system membrane component KefB